MDVNELLGTTEPAPWWVKLGGLGLIGLLAVRSFLRSGRKL